MRTFNLMTIGIVLSSVVAAPMAADAIENVRGKNYQLTRKHGPWMIMVTSFRDVRQEELKKDGMTAEQAAAELVFELREKGIPAYTYSQDAVKGEIDTRDRLGRDDRRIFAAQRDMICVLAGNYPSIEDDVGQKTLKKLKNFRPKFLMDAKSGAIIRPGAAQTGPLSGAFMTINPLLKPEEVVQKHVDKETRELNANISYFALVKNPKKYTVQVATFTGKSAMPLGTSAFREKESQFDALLQKPGFNLDRAGHDAENLAYFIRDPHGKFAAKSQKVKPKEFSQFADSGINEAWVYHDKYQSIVTIGGFDTPDDPRIRMIQQYYGPKLVPDIRLLSATKRTAEARRAVTDDEIAKLPKVWTTYTEQMLPENPDRDAQPLQTWSFDTEPKVIAVPRIK